MTSNIDLKQMARKNGIHVDIFARDDLPYLQNRKRKNNLIINLDKVNGKGTHWTALHINQPNNNGFCKYCYLLHYNPDIQIATLNRHHKLLGLLPPLFFLFYNVSNT